jgi:hypothetical protein
MSKTDFSNVGTNPQPPAQGICGFVHHIFENKFYQNKGGAWGPATVENVRLFLQTKYKIKKGDVSKTLIDIMENAQIYEAMNVAGYKSGVYKDKRNNPFLIVRSHQLIPTIEGDWSIIREMFESMFGPEQTPYIYGWSQWAYRSYETGSLAPRQLLVMVGPHNCGKTLTQERILSPLLGSVSAKCQNYLTQKTEFNQDLIANCSWVLSDSLSKLDYQDKKTLTEAIKDALVATEQRLRAMHMSPVTVNMCPRISASINWTSVDALPIFEDGMSDKMMLLKVAKSSRLPDEKTSHLEFVAQLDKALPAFAHFLKYEFVLPEECKEINDPNNVTRNIRFNVAAYHHPEILEKILDVKRHVTLAEILQKWRVYPTKGSSLDIYTPLTELKAPSKEAVKDIARSNRIFGRVLSELAKATEGKDEYCHGIKVIKPPRGDSQEYEIIYEDEILSPGSIAGNNGAHPSSDPNSLYSRLAAMNPH